MTATVIVHCPLCDAPMRARAEYLGKRGRCPSCKNMVDIVAPQETPVATLQAAQDRNRKTSAVSATDVSAWLAGVLGLVASVGLYLVVFLPLKNTKLGELFLERGIIPYTIVLVTCWGLATLLLKFLAVRRQQSYAELELELIPLEVGVEINPSNVDLFLDHLSKVPRNQRDSILGMRIQGSLEHFKSRTSVPEVQQYLATQAEIDASGVDAGYTLLRAFIWAVPILGFIGTVMGISAAVAGLSDTLTAGGEIREGLGGITTGLATAFDTTLIALAMAILLLFPTETLRKTEYRMLDRIESFANEQLLRRMADDDKQPSLDPENMPQIVRRSLEAAFIEHQRWLAQWQSQVAELGRVIGESFEQSIQGTQELITRNEAQRLEQIERTSQMVAQLCQTMANSPGLSPALTATAPAGESPVQATVEPGFVEPVEQVELTPGEVIPMAQSSLPQQQFVPSDSDSSVDDAAVETAPPLLPPDSRETIE